MAIKFLNTVQVDTGVLYVNTANDRVGIGTTSPGQKLDVDGNVNIDGSLFVNTTNNHIRLVDTDNTGNFSVGVNTNFQIRDITANTTPLLIKAGTPGNTIVTTSSGRVGIGLNSPGVTLHVDGFARLNGGLQMNATNAQIYQILDSDLRFGTNNTERMRIDNTGNVGIGTTSPSSKLVVSGSFRAGNNGYDSTPGGTAFSHTLSANSGSTRVVNFDGNGSNPSVWWNNANTRLGAIDGETEGLAFWTNNAAGNWNKNFYIQPTQTIFTQNVGIGMTAPLQPLSIENSSSPLIKIRNTTNGSGAAIEFNDNGTSAANQNGRISYYHSDSASQGGGSSFWLTGENDQTLVLANNGRVVVQKSGSASEVGYGFYDDVNTGMYHVSADALGFATGGTRRLDMNSSGVRIGTGSRVTTILDQDNMSSNSNTALATQQSIKAYVDNEIAGVPQGTVTGSGVNQRLAFWSGASSLSSDDELTWDGVNLNIGTYAGTGDCELRLFGSTPNNSFSTLKTTNGNLHIDSDNGHTIYLNYYSGGGTSVIIGNGNGGSSNTIFSANGDVSVGANLTASGTVTATGGFLVPYQAATKKPMINLVGATTYGLWHTEGSNDIFSFDFGGVSKHQFFQTGNATFAGDLTVSGGDIILGGTGRIQGVDTVSASTDAANKAYVDNAIAGVPQGDITAVIAGTGLTGGGTSGSVTLNVAGGTYTPYNDIRSLGVQAFTNGANPNITTAQVMAEIESDGGFDSYSSVFKTSWSYAGNYNLTDAGDFTETAGSSWITWTDNSSDTTRGNITALAIAPTTGGSAGGVFIYNDQGSSYSPGWRQVWTSTTDGAGSGLDADLLDGQQGSYYLDYANFTGTPTIPSVGNGQIDGRTSGLGLSGSMDATANQSGNTTFTVTSNAVTAATANTIAYRDSSADLNVRLLRSNYANQSTISGAMAFRVNNGADNYTRYCSSPSAIRTFLGVPASGDLNSYLLNTTDTFTGALTIAGDIRGNGQQLVLNAGEAYNSATGQTNEYVYINAEQGLEVNSSPDNWASGWAGRNTTTIGKADGTSSFSGKISVQGSNVIEIDQTYSYLNHLKLLSTFGSKLFSATNYGYVLESSSTPADPVTFRFDNDRYRIYSGSSGEALTVLANTNVGIGTTSPGAKLDVTGSYGDVIKAVSGSQNITTNFVAPSTGSGLNNITSTAGKFNIGTTDAQPFDLVTSSISRISIISTGKVGINNTNPTYQLHVSGNAGFSGQTTHSSGLVTSSTQSRNKISVWSSLSSYTIGMKNGFGYGGLGGDGTGTEYAMSFQMSNTTNRGWWWGDTSHSDVQGSMSLTTDGELVVAKSLSVGAGETTRTAADRPLEVTGNALIDGRLTIEGPAPMATSPMLELHRTSPVVDYKDLNSAGYFSLKERFLNSGSTVIGSREVSQNPGGSGIYHNFDNGASGGSQFHQRQNSFHWKINSTSEKLTLGTNGYIGINDTSPSYQLDVNGSGRFTSTVTATNFILSSDERLKENVKKVCDNRVKADWKTFELKTDKGQKRYGVIAQELEKTNPEFVREDSKGFKSVAYIDLLIAKIAELEARLEKLEK